MAEKLSTPFSTPPFGSLAKPISPTPSSPIMTNDQVTIVVQKLSIDVNASIPISFESKHTIPCLAYSKFHQLTAQDHVNYYNPQKRPNQSLESLPLCENQNPIEEIILQELKAKKISSK